MLHHYIAKLAAGGIIEASADHGATPLIRLIPLQIEFSLPRLEPLPQRVILNRFACLRRSERGAILQHPDAPFEVLIEDEVFGRLITGLASGARDIRSFTGALDHAFLALLVSPGFVADADAEEPPARQSWEFQDRLFHRTTRSHNDRLPRGATYRFLDQWPPRLRSVRIIKVSALPCRGRVRCQLRAVLLCAMSWKSAVRPVPCRQNR